MKITKQKLEKIIKEELSAVIEADTIDSLRSQRVTMDPISRAEQELGVNTSVARDASISATETLKYVRQIEDYVTKFRRQLDDVVRTAGGRNIDQHPPPGAGVPSGRPDIEGEKELAAWRANKLANLREIKKSLGTLLESIKI